MIPTNAAALLTRTERPGSNNRRSGVVPGVSKRRATNGKVVMIGVPSRPEDLLSAQVKKEVRPGIFFFAALPRIQ